MKYLVSILAGLVVLLAVGFQAMRCHYENQLADKIRAANNAKAEADTLRRYNDLWEKRAFTLSKGLHDATLMTDNLRNRLEKKDREAKALVEMYVEARGTIEFLSEAVAMAGDSTSIPLAYQDSVFGVEGETVFPGSIQPDPTPPTRTTMDVSARIRALTAISCDPDEASPHVNVATFDRRVSVIQLEAEVDEDVACLSALRPESPFSLDLMPEISPGTAWLAGGVGFLGFVLGKASN